MDAKRRKLATWLAVVFFIALFVAQAVTSMREKSVTVDEITYIAAGYYHLKTGDFLYNMTNPPLMKVVAALPLLFVNPVLPEAEGDPARWNAVEEWKYARRFLYDNRVDADGILFAARIPIVVIGALLGLAVFLWSAQMYGRVSGLFALFLFSFSPNVLAHTRLATQDVGVTFFVFSSVYFFWRYTTRRELWSLLFSASLFGCGILSKSTTAFVVPILTLYCLVGAYVSREFGTDERLPWVSRIASDRFRRRQLVSALWVGAIFAGMTLAVINVGYGFQGTLSGLPFVPTAYLRSILFQLRLSSFGGVYLAGDMYYPSVWFIVLATCLLKTPIPTLLLTLASAIRLAIRRRAWEAETLIALAIGIFIGAFVVLNNLGSILRYVLPIYPFCFVLASRLATEKWPYPRMAAALGGLLSVWYVAGSVLVHPHYLAYFNELIGGPKNGYRYLAESNLDWGQDLKGLKRYMKAEGIDRIPLGYFGSADAEYYGIDYDYLPSVGLAPKKEGQKWWYELDPGEPAPSPRPSGRIAVSVTLIQGPRWVGPLFEPIYGWLRELEPVETIGHTIHIYDIPPETWEDR